MMQNQYKKSFQEAYCMMRFKDKTIEFIIGWLYVLVLTWPMNALIHQKATVLILLITSLVGWYVIHVALGSKLGRIVFLSTMVIGTAGLLYLILSDGSQHNAFIRLMKQYGLLFERIYFYEPIAGTALESLLPSIDAFAVFAASLCVWFFFKLNVHFYALTAIGITSIIVGTEMIGFDQKIPFLLFCLLTILSYVRYVAGKRERAGIQHDQGGQGHFMLNTIPLLIIPLLVVSFIPKSDMPLRWNWLDQKIANTYDFFQQRFSYTNVEFFHLSATGFSNTTNRLGGRVRPNNTLVMTVTSNERAYLRGAAYTQYEGEKWSQLSVEDQFIPAFHSNEQDLLELETAWKYIPIEEMYPDLGENDTTLLTSLQEGIMVDVLFPPRLMTIQFKKLTTRTLFMPLKNKRPILDAGGKSMFVIENAHGIAVTEQQLPFDYQYSFEYHQPMSGDLLYRKALTFSKKGLYEEALSYLMLNEGEFSHSLTLSPNYVILRDLADRARRVQDTHTLLAVPTTQRVIDLAVELTKDEETDYEKALAIQDYLRENFPYTLESHRLPENKDFVDWFLFEEKKGYCTYYATAMAVMLRSIGIPTRYVEGYIMPDNGAVKSNFYRVTNQQAHAWTEVYFEGFGWLNFEPTPSYAGATDYLINPIQEVYATNGRDLYDLEALIAYYQDDPSMPGYDATATQQRVNMEKRLPLIMIWSVISLLAAFLFLHLIAGMVNQGRMNRKPPQQQVIMRYLQMLRWLKLAGLEIKPGETVTEFGTRIDKEFVLDPISFLRISELFTQVRFGHMTPPAAELLNMVIAEADLKRQILKDLGYKRFLPLRRIILGI
jgi:transglutaminase-like putative cysteine protease